MGGCLVHTTLRSYFLVPQVGGVHTGVGPQQALGPVQHQQEGTLRKQRAQAIHAVPQGPVGRVHLLAADVGHRPLQEPLKAGFPVVEAPPQRPLQRPMLQARRQKVVLKPVPAQGGLAHPTDGDDRQEGMGVVGKPGGEVHPLPFPPGEVGLGRAGVGDVGSGGRGDALGHLGQCRRPGVVERLRNSHVQRQPQRAQPHPTLLVHP